TARFILEPAPGGAYGLGKVHQTDVVLATSYRKPVVSITASAKAMREGSGRWTVTAQLDQPTADAVQLEGNLKRTAQQRKDYEAIPARLDIPAMKMSGELVVKLVDNEDFEPNGVELTVALSARGDVELRGGDTFTLSIEDDDSEGDLAVLVLLTPQLKEDW